jgi:hypothetical protein
LQTIREINEDIIRQAKEKNKNKNKKIGIGSERHDPNKKPLSDMQL